MRVTFLMRWNASVSVSDDRSQKISGMIAQPISSGMRHPQSPICCFVSMELTVTPSSAASITATCWLPDCHDV